MPGRSIATPLHRVKCKARWGFTTGFPNVPRCHLRETRDRGVSFPLPENRTRSPRDRAAVNNLRRLADGFQMIMSKRGYSPGLHEASVRLPSGEVHAHVMYQTVDEKRITFRLCSGAEQR